MLRHCRRDGDAPALSRCIDEGGDVNCADEKGATPLLLACQNGAAECARLLIAAGADVDQAQATGEFPLFAAAEGGHLEILRALLGRNAQLVQPNFFTPLHVASHKGHAECVRALLDAGSDPLRLCPLGWTPRRAADEGTQEPAVYALLGPAEQAARREAEEAMRCAADALYAACQAGRAEQVASPRRAWRRW